MSKTICNPHVVKVLAERLHCRVLHCGGICVS